MLLSAFSLLFPLRPSTPSAQDECGTQAGSENGCCINIPCSNYYNEDTCKAAKCQYSNGLCYSDPDPSKVRQGRLGLGRGSGWGMLGLVYSVRRVTGRCRCSCRYPSLCFFSFSSFRTARRSSRTRRALATAASPSTTSGASFSARQRCDVQGAQRCFLREDTHENADTNFQ